MNYDRQFKIQWNNIENLIIVPSNEPQIISAHKLRVIHSPILGDNGLGDWQVVIEEIPNNILGQCDYQTKTITVNPMMFYTMTSKQVRMVLIHEVSHALCPGERHNEVWRQKDLELGGTGNQHQAVESVTCVDEERQHYKIVFG